jgi:hypothetical protein
MYTFPAQPTVCPTCGRCPTCGHSTPGLTPYPIYPGWSGPYITNIDQTVPIPQENTCDPQEQS